jgi:hypothetical protein
VFTVYEKSGYGNWLICLDVFPSAYGTRPEAEVAAAKAREKSPGKIIEVRESASERQIIDHYRTKGGYRRGR